MARCSQILGASPPEQARLIDELDTLIRVTTRAFGTTNTILTFYEYLKLTTLLYTKDLSRHQKKSIQARLVERHRLMFINKRGIRGTRRSKDGKTIYRFDRRQYVLRYAPY